MNSTVALLVLPEIVLTAGASLLLLIPLIGKGRHTGAKWWMLGVLAATLATIFYAASATAGDDGGRFAQMFALDGFAIFFKVLLIAAVALVTLLSEDFLGEAQYSPWEYYSLIAFALCGMSFMVSGTHLVSIYVGLELLSLSSYILAGYYKKEEKSTEAAMKYLILGAVSSAILLYGMSLIFGAAGTLSLSGITTAIASGMSREVLIIGVLMMGAGLCFKIAAVPFHVWTPDVYVGAPTPITAFLSTASKAAALAIFARIFYTSLGHLHADWSAVVATASALSMIVGNVAALTQDNVKRMLAYSSIAHAGYALMGIVAMNELGLYGILVYALVYVFANLGIWATVLMMRRHQYAGESIEDFEGLSARSPFQALAMVIFLLSLGGIPPTAGFIGKYFLFAAAVQSGYGWLAIIGVLTSALSMFYYLRLVVAMYLKEGREAEVAMTVPLRFAAAVCLVITLAFGVAPEPLLHGVRSSLRPMIATALQADGR